MRRVHGFGSVALGVVFLFAGVSKAFDPWSFHVTLPDYGITGIARTILAMAVPTLEVVLGTALIVRWQIRRMSLLTVLSFAAFIVAIGIGWWRGTLEECGCFGAMLERSPGEAIAIDSLFLVVAIGIWRGAPAAGSPHDAPTRWKRSVLALAGTVTLAMTVSLFFAGTTGIQATLEADPHPEMRSVDLKAGEHLLYLFHPECPLCARMSPRVAGYLHDPALPPVVGFTTLTTRADVDAYRQQHDLKIPVQILSRDSLSRITGDGAVPQLVYVRNGEVVRNWVTEMPVTDELRSDLGSIPEVGARDTSGAASVAEELR